MTLFIGTLNVIKAYVVCQHVTDLIVVQVKGPRPFPENERLPLLFKVEVAKGTYDIVMAALGITTYEVK